MNSVRRALQLLRGDPLAVVSAIILLALLIVLCIGPGIFGPAISLDLAHRNAPPFVLSNGIVYFLGGDSLGRPILPRLIEGGRGTLAISASVVVLSFAVGGLLGIVAGYRGRSIDAITMRIADTVMSFPSLLLAVIVLYIFPPSVLNVVYVLAITRTPIYIRLARAETLEARERLFIDSARASGATDLRILAVHIAPIILPSLFTLATLDFANVMLAESALSFLGIGVQPPDVTWGAMVANGRNYLTTAWWLAIWPGMTIAVTALSTNLLSNWLRIAMDPKLNWRLERIPAQDADPAAGMAPASSIIAADE